MIELLDKLMEDCMGHVLIGALNHPIKIITRDKNVNGYNHNANPPEIHLMMNPESNNIHDVILLEELFHAYQRQRLGDASYNKRRLNCEIEAKLAWLMYRQRLKNPKGIENALKGEYGRIAFEWLADAYRSNSTQMLKLSYVDAAKELQRKSLVYYKYSFSKNDYNLNNLSELSLDCIKEKQL